MRRAFFIGSIGIIAIAMWVIVVNYNNNSISVPVTPTEQTNISPVYFREIAHGVHSTVTTRANYLITSSLEFSALWKMIDAPGQKPTIDFTKNNVMAVFSGSKSTAGYDITVSKIEDTESRMVKVLLTKPGVSCLLAESTTNPYQVIEVSKTELTLTHEDKETTVGCLQ
jgi:hypothetical protein